MADDRSLDLQGVKADGESTGEGEKAGRQMAMYSAPVGAGEL